MDTLSIQKEQTKMVAHRGLSGLETENTYSAFLAAANRSYFAIELDVHITKDGHFVVNHDYSTKRLSDQDLVISQSTLEELQKVELYEFETRIPSKHNRIITLLEALQVCQKYEKQVLIEIKPSLFFPEIEKLYNLVKSTGYLKQVYFISFQLENLKLLRKLSKEVRLQYLVNVYDPKVLDMCKKLKMGVNIHFKELSLEIVRIFHNNFIEVNVHTVDNPIVALMLVTWNVDMITTNILE